MQLAIVTGASSGIGAAFARALAARGCNLLLVARRAERLQTLADTLERDFRVSAEIRTADLADPDQTKALAAHLSQLPQIDYLINNAGFGADTPIAQADAGQQLNMLHVHINAPFLLTHAALPKMIDRRAGAIINVSSIAGFFHGPNSVNYCASKAYLTSFSESLQLELREYGVKVQALCPGYTVTEFHDTPLMSQFRRENVPASFWDSAEFVVNHSLDHLKLSDPVTIIPGRQNQLRVAAVQLPFYLKVRKMGGRILRLLKVRG